MVNVSAVPITLRFWCITFPVNYVNESVEWRFKDPIFYWESFEDHFRQNA